MSNENPAPLSPVEKIEGAARALRQLAEVLKSGPQTGLVRVGPGIAGLRTVTMAGVVWPPSRPVEWPSLPA